MYRAMLMVTGLVLMGCPGFGSKTLDDLAPDTDEITYYQHIEPILRERCTQCHSDPPRLGAFNSLATAEQAKNQSARIHTRSVVEMTMPPGSPLDAEDRALIDTWYRTGAPLGTPPEGGEDGDIQDMTLATDAGIEMDADIAEEPTWTDHIAPIMNVGCAFDGCHGPNIHQGGLDLSSYAGYQAGGDSGDITGDDNADSSLFVDRLRERNGRTLMPPAGALSEREIQLIEKWIDLGSPEE